MRDDEVGPCLRGTRRHCRVLEVREGEGAGVEEFRPAGLGDLEVVQQPVDQFPGLVAAGEMLNQVVQGVERRGSVFSRDDCG